MREIRTSGSTRGEWAALCVAPSPTLPALIRDYGIPATLYQPYPNPLPTIR
jgi:hypothetical protein